MIESRYRPDASAFHNTRETREQAQPHIDHDRVGAVLFSEHQPFGCTAQHNMVHTYSSSGGIVLPGTKLEQYGRCGISSKTAWLGTVVACICASLQVFAHLLGEAQRAPAHKKYGRKKMSLVFSHFLGDAQRAPAHEKSGRKKMKLAFSRKTRSLTEETVRRVGRVPSLNPIY